MSSALHIMNAGEYFKAYIQKALNNEMLSAPDRRLFGTEYDAYQVLLAIYDASRKGGYAAIRQAWEIGQSIMPEVFARYGVPTRRLLLRLDELENLPLPRYAIERYPIYAKGFNMMYGRPGSGKSLVALDFAGHLASVTSDRSVIYVAAEGREGMHVRWKAWQQHHQTELKNVLVMLEALSFLNDSKVAEFKNVASEYQPCFIVIDTLARSMVGVNENDTTAMGLFVEAVDHLRHELDCGILFVHHTNKLGGMRGSTVLEGAMDSILKIQPDGLQIVVHNSLEQGGKNKDREEAAPMYLNKLPVQVTINDEQQSAVVIELSEKMDQSPAEDAMNHGQRQLLEILSEQTTGLTAKELLNATSLPQASMYRHLKQLRNAGFVLHDRQRDKFVITPAGQTASR